MTIHRTFLNYQEETHVGEINNQPSETQPDMTMSLEELLRRHSRGLEIPTRDPQYHGEDIYIPDHVQDILDYQSYAEQNQESIDSLNAQSLREAKQAKNERGELGASAEDIDPLSEA